MREIDEGLWREIQALRRRVEALEGFEHQKADEDAWRAACAAFLALPGLRGFWPMSAFDSSGNAQDVSGHGHHLTYTGAPTYSQDGIIPFIAMGGSGRLVRSDEADLDITGGESYVASATQGLTLGGWFYVVTLDDYDRFMAKYDGTTERSYWLYEGTTAQERATFGISSDGAATGTVSVSSANGSVPASVWRFIAGRFDPSTSLDVFVNAVKATNTTSIPATIYSGSADFAIGANGDGTNAITARIALAFLCAAAVSDGTVEALYQATRGMFGV